MLSGLPLGVIASFQRPCIWAMSCGHTLCVVRCHFLACSTDDDLNLIVVVLHVNLTAAVIVHVDVGSTDPLFAVAIPKRGTMPIRPS